MDSSPCAVCNTDCIGHNDIACDICNEWLHYTCENLSEQEFKFLNKTKLSYICYRCLYRDRCYNFDMALQRLFVAASNNLFDEGVRLERIFMRYEPSYVDSFDNVAYHQLVQDQTAKNLLGNVWSGSSPVVVNGNGNCLFNAISVILFGNEDASSELRLKTFFEMSENTQFYERVHSKTLIPEISPTLTEATRQCAQDMSWSSAWTIHALSIGKPIKSVYPVVNGPHDSNINILNTVFKPRASRCRQEVAVMWSGAPRGIGTFWKANHFVPLIPFEQMSCSPICIDDLNEFPPLVKKERNSSPVNVNLSPIKATTSAPFSPIPTQIPGPSPVSPAHNSTCHDTMSSMPLSLSPVDKIKNVHRLASTPLKSDSTCSESSTTHTEATVAFSDISDPHLQAMISSFVDKNSLPDLGADCFQSVHMVESFNDSSPESHVTVQEDMTTSDQDTEQISAPIVLDTDLDHDISAMEVTNLSIEVVHPYKNPTTNSITSFLNIDKLYELATTPNPDISSIPPGIKQNVFFVIDDTENRNRRLMKKYSEYPDDCGAWQQGKNSTKPMYFLKSGETLHYIESRGGAYGKRVKKVFTPFEPQPSTSDIVVAMRKYSTLARHNGYKKRVTWFNCEPVLSTAIVEYIGEYPTNIPHGHAKHTTVPYRSKTTEQKTIIRQGLQNDKPPRDIRRDVNTATPDNIIDHRVAQNAKHYNKTKTRPHTANRLNVADDVLTVLNMFVNSNFVREVITTSSKKPPSIILYTDQQMAMLKNAISTGVVIGVDRTFNLSSTFLTPLCFQNTNLISKSRSTSPVMLGPMLLHWDGQFDSYHKFFSHLQAKLVGTDQSKLIFGSDEESAAIKALDLCFPHASRVLCAKHLKDNAAENLRKVLPQPEVAEILSKLFNPDGILKPSYVIDRPKQRQDVSHAEIMGGRLSCTSCTTICDGKDQETSNASRSNISDLLPVTVQNNKENKTSAQILRELRIHGFFEQAEKHGGVRFTIDSVDIRSKAPRRLPNLKRARSQYEDEPSSNAAEEVELMEEIRRIRALTEGGDMVGKKGILTNHGTH